MNIMNITKRNHCQIILCEYMQDFKIILLQISGTYLNVTQCEKKINAIISESHIRIQKPEPEDENKLHYHIECRSINQLDGYCSIIDWLTSLCMKIESSQLFCLNPDKYEFQITFSVEKNTHISDMKLAFYEICDDFGLDGSIELA
jgi:glycine cleavage system regulatory protein